jgi:para-nitrobenzyl esterase
MVWLYGGEFSAGCENDYLCTGKNLFTRGDVVVTVDHRLNVFGFLQLSDAWGPKYASSGQAGMLDINWNYSFPLRVYLLSYSIYTINFTPPF